VLDGERRPAADRGNGRQHLISDELNHASIIDGCRLAAAKRLRYKHADMNDLEAKLREAEGTAFVVTDGVFSMEGSLANLPAIVELAKRYGAVTIVDDSHGTGVMGRTGRGTIEHFGLEGQIDILTGTLGKALGGAAGGFVAGSAALVDTLVQRSRTQLFSNALPATVAASALRRSNYSKPGRNCSRGNAKTSPTFAPASSGSASSR
jgi:glycine C-acetyltransferase